MFLKVIIYPLLKYSKLMKKLCQRLLEKLLNFHGNCKKIWSIDWRLIKIRFNNQNIKKKRILLQKKKICAV